MAANWRASAWQMEFVSVDKLIEKIQMIPNKSESIMNSTLKSKGAPKAIDFIQPEIPISSWKGHILKKKHASQSNALTVKHGNLQFTIRPKPSFNYIKYPDLGIGTSIKNEPKKFMKNGLDIASQYIVNDLTNAVIDEINRTLGE
jgi:hypothetical protein